ncbi:L-iditol 2-dehydrogenase [Taklimakanibacter albus]|uniref:L-iditol 2-dehydrogenase n=1 Tax=Taklimakanibacter albus TaxID=2800327 RepID=A0ACC5RB44_9HYPH|nr:L-iditol 2-dehydrogenase [Aestuariivirga sp. YIM B02566]MBK1869862.1 L-iditol 2-dehydrogenase [Aestuariivirga sp. YIM B02566]
MRLEHKTAIVTGGARGIGRAIAEGFAREGARVCIADIDEDVARATARETGGGAFAAHLDVTRMDSINRMIGEVETKAGGVDILVNNAAIFDMAPIEEITEKSYDRIFTVNVKGLLFTLQAAAKSMIKRGKGGKIINMASQAGRRGEALVAVYCASKAAVISLTQSSGLGLIKHRINVNGIAPGVVDTPMWDEVDALFAKYEGRPPGEKKRLVGEGVPFGRMGKPEDHVGCAIFLASAESDYVVAQTFNVDGGQWMS